MKRVPGEGYGAAFRGLRERAGMDQGELASASGVSSRTVGRIENEEGPPTLTTIHLLLEAMGMTLYDLARAIDEVEGRTPQRTAAEADPRVVAALTRRWTKNDADWILGYAAGVIDPEEPGSHERFAASVEVAAAELARFVLSQMAAPRTKDADEPSN